MIAYIIHNASDMKFIHSFSYNLKIQQREVMPYNKTHIGRLLEEEREGADKGREREAEIGP